MGKKKATKKKTTKATKKYKNQLPLKDGTGFVLYNEGLDSYVTVTARKHPFAPDVLVLHDSWFEQDQVRSRFDFLSKTAKVVMMPGVHLLGEL